MIGNFVQINGLNLGSINRETVAWILFVLNW
ncbi:hypothetical protein SAMN05421509_102380 [Chromohalobacter canadensis]|uniref:Uncharacterized protein n=1 Tax=Chromohalobacter canadensis TaxID=141389 RepID=A0A285VHU4_9GAMM|nr:hypothetical protein SAMN05421509_102380 [Chromohalobacter canadensis]